tara:strand:+ start:4227 stop:9788 length:5562 start_codon:yes stop_codon:yes gene_type:complete
MKNRKSVGLKGGPNEFLVDITQYISIEGYKNYSDDVTNPVNIIESGNITMKDVDFPVLGTDNLGNSQMMFPENDYQFPGDSVVEIPMAQDGGNLTTQLRNFDYDKKRNKPFAKSGGSVSWKWKGKSYSGKLIPSMETSKARYARTENGKVKTLPKAETGNLPKHLDPVDLSKINEQNKEKINSSAYRDRLKKEYLNAHDIELNDEQLDGMVSDLNNQLTFGANEGNTGFYTQNVPDPSAAGFMMSGYDQIDASGNQVGPGSDTFDTSNPTRGNIYIARDASQKAPFTTINNEDGTSMEDSIIQHEINHRLNSLKGSPLSSSKRNPLYNQSYDYHNSFFDNAPDDNPFNPNSKDKDFTKYATQPFEIKSQKAQLEQALLDAGIWDPSKGPFTQADVDKMVNSGISFNKGFDYLPQGLGINELVDGTVKEPGKLPNKMDYYTDYTNEKINDFLGNKGYEDFSTSYGDADMRNTSQRPFERIKKSLDNTKQGSKKWNEWSEKRQEAQNNYFNANSDTRELKDVLDGKNDMPGEKITALLKSKGIEVGPEGWYEKKDDAAIRTIYNEFKKTSDDYRLTYDDISDDRPKEDGLFGAFGPIKNFKGKKAEREAVKQYNQAYGTDFKEWGDIEFENSEANVSQEDKNVRKNADKYTGYGDTKQSFEREIDDLNTILSGTGGYDTRREFYNNKFKLKGDYRPNRKGGRNEFNKELANSYMNDLKNDPNYDPKKDVFNNKFVPPNRFDDASSWAYEPNAEKLQEQNREGFNTALDNNVWRDDLFTQAVLNLRAKDRDAFIEYYNQDPDQKFETKADIKKQKKLVNTLKSSMSDIRQFLEKTRDNNNKFIENSNRQYEIDQQQQLNNDQLNNKELNQKISPNLIKFMNEVAMEDGNQSTFAKDGVELPQAVSGGGWAKLFKEVAKQFKKVPKKLNTAKDNIQSGMSGTRLNKEGQTEYWDGLNWRRSSKQQAIDNIEKLRKEYLQLGKAAKDKVIGAEVRLLDVEKKMGKLTDDFERQGFDTKELHDEAFLNMFSEYQLFNRGAKDQKRIISDMTDEYNEMKGLYRGDSGQWDKFLEGITKGEKIDQELVKKHLDKSLWSRIKQLGETFPGGVGDNVDGPLRFKEGGNTLPKAQFGRNSIMMGDAYGLRPEGSTGVLGDGYDAAGITDMAKDGNYDWLFGSTETGGGAGALASNALDILSVPANLMAEAVEYFGERGDKEFNFSDAMPGFSGDFSFTNWNGGDLKTVSGTTDTEGKPLVENFWGGLAVDIFTDPSTYVGAGLIKSAFTKGPKVANVLKTIPNSTDDILKKITPEFTRGTTINKYGLPKTTFDQHIFPVNSPYDQQMFRGTIPGSTKGFSDFGVEITGGIDDFQVSIYDINKATGTTNGGMMTLTKNQAPNINLLKGRNSPDYFMDIAMGSPMDAGRVLKYAFEYIPKGKTLGTAQSLSLDSYKVMVNLIRKKMFSHVPNSGRIDMNTMSRGLSDIDVNDLGMITKSEAEKYTAEINKMLDKAGISERAVVKKHDKAVPKNNAFYSAELAEALRYKVDLPNLIIKTEFAEGGELSLPKAQDGLGWDAGAIFPKKEGYTTDSQLGPVGNYIEETNKYKAPATWEETIDFIDLDGLKEGISQAESIGGVLMLNKQSTATGLYGQKFSEIKKGKLYDGTRKEFAKDLDAQNRLFEDRLKIGFKPNKTTPLLRDAWDLTNEYAPQITEFDYSYEDIIGLANFLGRKGTRIFLGDVIRDGKSLEEALPNMYGPDRAKDKNGKPVENKTPQEYLSIIRQYYKEGGSVKKYKRRKNKRKIKAYGGEMMMYERYISGGYDGTPMEKAAINIYDKINRKHYKEAKELGMSPANYVMTYLVNNS